MVIVFFALTSGHFVLHTQDDVNFFTVRISPIGEHRVKVGKKKGPVLCMIEDGTSQANLQTGLRARTRKMDKQWSQTWKRGRFFSIIPHLNQHW